jgi:hypothetical protein
MITRKQQITLAIALCLWASAAGAQTPNGGAQPSPQAKPTTPPQPQVDSVLLAVLIKSAVVALQQANATGNYSVLRDLGSPVFRERFDQAKLTAIFSNLRSRGVNLSGALMLMPNLTKPPEISPQGQLHVVGNFPTQPLQIQYDLVFWQLDGIWRLDGIAVDAVAIADTKTAPASSPTAAASTPDAQAKAQGKKTKPAN